MVEIESEKNMEIQAKKKNKEGSLPADRKLPLEGDGKIPRKRETRLFRLQMRPRERERGKKGEREI